MQPSETKILRLLWDKTRDTLSVTLSTSELIPTMKYVLSHLAQVYDTLRLVSSLTLEGKFNCQEILNEKLP